MASIDKLSVRDEFEKIKIKFNQLSEDGEISPAAILLFHSTFLLLQLVFSIFMEKTTKKNNHNSSKPSSQTDKDDTTPDQSGSKGKGKKENEDIASNTRTVETVTTAQVTLCHTCGEDLSNTPACGCERRTKIDIIFEKIVEHTDAEIKECPTCHAENKGVFPDDMPGPKQYGNGLKAYVVNLIVGQMVALGRVQKMVKSLIGVMISEATMLKYVLRLHEALADWEKEATERMLTCPAINVDETSLRVNKKNQWIHVYCAGDITLKFLHPSRGKEAIEHINIIPRYDGIIIHDCWASYLSYNHCGHGLCGSHLLRELVFIIESNGYAWATNMKRLLKETAFRVAKSKRKKLTKKQYANLQKRYRNILTRGEKALPIIPPKPNGKKGKIAKSDAHNLWERLQEHEEAVLLFAKNANVSFTNNRAERDLRMGKVKQKISGCFRNSNMAKAYCRISSYLQTMANKGYNPLIAIQMALEGNIPS